MAKQPQIQAPELGPALDILEVLSLGIVRFRWWILPFAFLGLAIGSGVALVQVNSYISDAKLWVDWNEDDTLSPNEQMGIAASRQPGGKTGWTVKQELQVLLTKVLDEMIVREVGVERLTQPINPMQFDHAGTPTLTRWQHIAQDWWHNGSKKPQPVGVQPEPKLNIDSPKGMAAAVTKLRKVRISPGGDHIISVKVSANSPELAQDMAAATAKAIIERHEQLFSRGQTEEFKAKVVEKYESEEADAKNTLNAHRGDCGFYDIEKMEPIMRNELAVIEAKRESYEEELVEHGVELPRARELLETLPKKVSVTKEEELGPNPAYREVQENIRKLESDKIKASRILKGAELDKQNREFESDIEIQKTFLAGINPQIVVKNERVVEEDNPEYLKTKERIAFLEGRTAQLLKLKDRNAKKESQKRAELLALENCKPVHSDMRENIQEVTSVIRKINKGQADQEIQSLLAQSGFKNIHIMEQPSYNPNKHKPDRGITVLMGLGIGLGVGILFTILRQLLDSKFRYPKSVATSLGVPVLGVIPEQRDWRRIGASLRNQSA